jgi:broad specificity phosphatase PhoE
MISARVYLARHGVTQANLDATHAGMSDVPLLPEGREQARRLAERVSALGSIKAVWTSPIRRARETAEIVAQHCGLPLLEERELREMEVGEWEGLTDDQIRERFPDAFRRWQQDPASFRLPGRETLDAVRGRIVAAVEHISARGVPALVISHSEPIRLLRVHYSGRDLNRFAEFMPGHAQLLELAREDGRIELRPVDDPASGA